MVKSTGVDIIEIERVYKNLNNERFIFKIYTSVELEYLKSRKMNKQTAAGYFAAKEAISKCLGTGFSTFGPSDIEINKDINGKPTVKLYKNALAIAESLNINNIHLSISHSKDFAVAFCVAE